VNGQPSQLLYPAVAVTIVAFVLLVSTNGPAVMGSSLAIVAGILALAGLISIWQPRWQLLLTGFAAHGAILLLVNALPEIEGKAELGFWCLVISAALTAWAFGQSLWAATRHPGLLGVALVVLFVFWVLVLWEIVARGAGESSVLPPAPSTLWADTASRQADQ
jgi:hypothetical protein